jgi:hypothetical protein
MSIEVAADAEPRHEFVLSALRCAALRARLVAAEIDNVGVALKAGVITSATAVAWAEEVLPGCFELLVELPPTEAAA